MADWRCTIHDLAYSFDEDAEAVKKVKDFYSRCPVCSINENRALKAELDAVRDRLRRLVDGVEILQQEKVLKAKR